MSSERKRSRLSSRCSILTGVRRDCKEKTNGFATEAGSIAEIARLGAHEDALVALLETDGAYIDWMTR